MASACLLSCSFPEPRYEQFFIGTYTGSGSEGIYSSLLNLETGELTEPKLSAKTDNPSFFTIHTNQSLEHTVLTVNEVSNYGIDTTGSVSAFAVHVMGTWGLKGQISSKGAFPCHISLDRSGKFVFVANYMGGIAAYRLDEKGVPGELTAMIEQQGSGPNAKRQDRPHPHFIQATRDNKYVLLADLGVDKIMIYRFDAVTGTLTPNEPAFAAVEPGAGPRHLVMDASGHRVYVLNELNSTISYFILDPTTGALSLRQNVSMLPVNFTGDNTGAEIALDSDGDILYASNRGHDSIVMFDVDKSSGQLSAVSWTSTGKGPRHFSLDLTGKWLLVASQHGNTIEVFGVNHDGKKLSKTSNKIEISSPVCIRFVGADSN